MCSQNCFHVNMSSHIIYISVYSVVSKKNHITGFYCACAGIRKYDHSFFILFDLLVEFLQTEKMLPLLICGMFNGKETDILLLHASFSSLHY